MTTNIERAAEEIRRVDGNHTLGAGALAEALYDGGYLMPDLPEPDSVKLNGDRKFFISGGVQVRHNASGEIWVIPHDQPLTTGQARQVALALLAAANHAEQEQDNE